MTSPILRRSIMRRALRFLPHRPFVHVAAACLVLTGLVACDSMGNLLNPGRPGDGAPPAMVAFTATLPRLQQSAFDVVELRVEATYQRADESFAALGASQLLPLADMPSQQVPLTLDLGPCLTDPQRMGATSDPGACTVRLTLTLLGDGRELDQVRILGLRLAPGATATVPQTIELYEVATVDVTSASSTTPLPAQTTLTAGSTFALAARPADATGAPITGRAVAWSSSAAAVATVSDAGVITAVAPGEATITATVGGRSGTAGFVVIPPPQRLTIASAPGSGNGRIVSAPAGIDCTITAGEASGSCEFDFAFGASVALTAEFTSDAQFSGWTGACLTAGMTPTCSLTMNEPRTAGASFTGLRTITVQSSGSGVLITSSPTPGINCTLDGSAGSGSCSAAFPIGTSVVLSVVDLSIARVSGFEGCDAATATSCSITVGTAARMITVNVTPGRLLVVSPAGGGSGLITAPGVDPQVTNPDISCGQPSSLGTGRCSTGYPHGSQVTITATPQSGSRFDGWSGGGCDNVSGTTCTVTLTEPTLQVVARFEIATVPLIVQLSGSGGGRVLFNGDTACVLSASETSVQCDIGTTAGLLPGDTVTLVGEPLGNGQFLGFGPPCASGSECSFVVTGPLTISATFTSTPATGRITVVPSSGNTGTGHVHSEDEELSCLVEGSEISEEGCETTRPTGSTITLIAQDLYEEGEGSYYVFDRWGPGTPCPNSTALSCTFVVNEDIVVDVRFVPAVYMNFYVDGSAPGQVTVTASNFRTLPTCAFSGDSLSGGIECDYYVPLNANLIVTASTSSQNFVSVFEFPCSPSGPPNTRSCVFLATSSLSGMVIFGAGDDELLTESGAFARYEEGELDPVFTGSAPLDEGPPSGGPFRIDVVADRVRSALR